MTAHSSLVILALVLSGASTAAQHTYRPKRDLSWGREAGGLRMAAWTNPAIDTVFVAVRNASGRSICHCEPEHAYSFSVYARSNSALPWQELEFKTRPEDVVTLALCHGTTLKPGQEMPSDGSPKDHSFSVDLRGYRFPPDWSGAVDVKIVQSLVYCSQTGNKVGELESPTVRIRLP